MIRCIALIVFVFILPFGLTAGEGGRFVDFDGDGFNDNIIDLDNNSIPDSFQKKVHNVLPATTASLTEFFSMASGGDVKSQSLPHADRFFLKNFVCRSLSVCRADFERNFSSQSAGGSSGGSSCAGGLCF